MISEGARKNVRRGFGGDMRKRLEGTSVGFWSVLAWTGNGYECRCRCGTERVVSAQSLLRRDSLSCGCASSDLRREALAKRKEKELAKFREKFE